MQYTTREVLPVLDALAPCWRDKSARSIRKTIEHLKAEHDRITRVCD